MTLREEFVFLASR